MTDIFYDTEFVDDGVTIDLVSIGMVSLPPHSGELYYIVADDRVIERVARHPWLTNNVLPHLPVFVDREYGRTIVDPRGTYNPVKSWEWNPKHPDFKCVAPKSLIRDEVRKFILSRSHPQLWAWYGAYDHVALAQLFGSMVDLPHGVPMYTNDLKQECNRRGNPKMPAPAENAHNALADASWVAAAHALLTGADDA